MNGKCVELGVYECHFSKLIIEETEPIQLSLVDAFHEEPGTGESGMYINHDLNQNYANELVRQIHSTTSNINMDVVQGLSKNVVDRFEDESLDWVYIDASHYEEDVKFDLDTWSKKVKPGGYVCGHDYPNPLLGKEYNVNGGVESAVDDYCKKNNYNIDYITATVDGLYTSDDVSLRFIYLMMNFYGDLRWRNCDYAIQKR